MACLIECVVCGTADVSRIEREKIRKALGHSKKLHSSIASAMQIVDGGLMWDFDKKRVYDLALKLARGHIAFEEYARLDEPSCVYVNPICTMPDDMVGLFLCDTEYGEVDLWPEIGSRSFLRAVLDVGTGTGYCPSWICVQDFRYRYKMTANGDVLIVIREYLGIYVSWE